MAITLAYPSLAAPSGSVVLPDVENLPSSRPVRVQQSVLETDAGGQIVIDHGNKIRQ